MILVFFLAFVLSWYGICIKDVVAEEGAVLNQPVLKETKQWQLLEVYPHDESSFTQGFTWYNNQLYESTGQHGQSSVRKVDLSTGTVTAIQNLDKEYFGEGMAIHDGVIHQITWRSGVGFLWDAETLEPLGEFTFTTSNGQGWGLTSDKKHLITSDGSHTLTVLDPETHDVVRTVQVTMPDGKPVVRMNELEYVQGYVLANVWFEAKIYKVDPSDGRVVDVLDFTELYPKAQMRQEVHSREACLNGIAYNEGEDVLYLTGKLWPNVYKVKLLDSA